MRSIVYIFILLSGVALSETYSLDTTYISWGETLSGRVGASIGEKLLTLRLGLTVLDLLKF